MKRTFATFKADFPDQAQWTKTGSPLVPDGKSISMTIAEGLRKFGLSPSEIAQHSFYGWKFEIVLPQCTVFCLLQGGEPWLLIIDERKRGLAQIFQAIVGDDIDAILRAIDGTLKQDARFSLIRWFTKQEYESGSHKGSGSPFSCG